MLFRSEAQVKNSTSAAEQAYSYVIDGITRVFGKQILWFLMNFVEAQFYAGVFAGAGIILGGIAAWFLAKNNSRLMGFSVCYGSPAIVVKPPWITVCPFEEAFFREKGNLSAACETAQEENRLSRPP